jgi:nitroreductase
MTGTSTPTQVIDQLKWRYAAKKFDPTRTIPDDVWHALEQSLVLAPSSFGLQPWKFFVVRNPALKQQLVGASWNQGQVGEASHVVVLAIKTEFGEGDVDRFLARMSQVQGTPLEALDGFAKVVKGFIANAPFSLEDWAAKQVYIALGQFMTTAAMLGVDTCPMEGFIPAKYDEILGLVGSGYRSVLVCPAGYRSAEDKSAMRPKVRYETADVVSYID